MRDIKLRAWDEDLKAFVPAFLDESGWYTYHRDTGVKSNGFILTQSTGLKDKNGKEIFEGDIVSAEIGSNKYYHPVKYKNGHYIAGTNLIYSTVRCFKMEVVGNIFES